MKYFKYILLSSLITVSSTCLAKNVELTDNYPYEFSQAIKLGEKKVRISVGDDYKAISHDLSENHHSMGFILDNQSADEWTSFISVHININTNQTASQTVKNLQKYIKKQYTNVKIYDTEINRMKSGVQEATSSIFFTDEIGDVVVSVKYYSDNSSLLGVEVSERVNKSSKSARNKTERIADKSIRL